MGPTFVLAIAASGAGAASGSADISLVHAGTVLQIAAAGQAMASGVSAIFIAIASSTAREQANRSRAVESPSGSLRAPEQRPRSAVGELIPPGNPTPGGIRTGSMSAREL